MVRNQDLAAWEKKGMFTALTPSVTITDQGLRHVAQPALTMGHSPCPSMLTLTLES